MAKSYDIKKRKNSGGKNVRIHPTCVIHKKVFLDNNVEMGPYTTIEQDVIIGENTKTISRYS